MHKAWYEVANDWIVVGCDDCGNDFYFCIHRRHMNVDISCPNCGGSNVFETGEKVDGRIVFDDWLGEEDDVT